MSYGVTPIAVSIEQVESVIGVDHTPTLLRRLLGSPTDRLIHTLKRKFGHRFKQDEVFDDDEPTLEQALADLLTGNDLDAAYGHKYGYALELLCDHFGEVLDNSAWSAMRAEWAEQVQAAMQQVGIDEDLLSVTNHLLYRGSPISIPEPSDFPYIGFLWKNEIRRALRPSTVLIFPGWTRRSGNR